jgi:hypothetical protein
MKVDTIRKLIASTGKRIGFVKFIKRDGTLREMWFQSDIPPKVLSGGELPYSKEEKHISIVYDIEKKQPRAIRWESVQNLSVCGRKVVVHAMRK